MGPTVNVKKLHEDAVMPEYSKVGDAGADLCCVEDFTLWAGMRKLVKTGIAIELPKGYEAQVRPRSGLAYKKGITIVNAPGTVDEGYRGDVGVILMNTSTETVKFKAGDRIAQLVIKPVEQAEFKLVQELGDSERGAGGFGSTGE